MSTEEAPVSASAPRSVGDTLPAAGDNRYTYAVAAAVCALFTSMFIMFYLHGSEQTFWFPIVVFGSTIGTFISVYRL